MTRTEGKKERKKIERDIEGIVAAMTKGGRNEKEKIVRDVEKPVAMKATEEQKEKRTHRKEITLEVTRYVCKRAFFFDVKELPVVLHAILHNRSW